MSWGASVSPSSIGPYPGVAQLVARMVRVHEAVGSNPATRTIGESFKDSPIFYCAFVTFLILLHGNVQLLVIWGLHIEGLVPYYVQEAPI